MTDNSIPQSDADGESLKEAAKFLERMVDFMQRKTETCLRCGGHVERIEKVGRSIYARPCGCRLWQGVVLEAWK